MTVDVEEARREARVRRRLACAQMVVRKDRVRTWNVDHHGGYMLVDAVTNYIVGGQRFDLTLEDLERMAMHPGAAGGKS